MFEPCLVKESGVYPICGLGVDDLQAIANHECGAAEDDPISKVDYDIVVSIAKVLLKERGL